MRKLLLLSAAALIAGAANAQVSAPTLTQDWTYSADKLPADAGTRWATGYNGVLYLQDSTNGKLICLDGENSTEIETGVKGFAISSDEAGNIIINTSAGGGTASLTYQILPAGKTSASDLVELSVTAPEGCKGGRMDMMGRTIGNVMSATGGAFYTLANTNTKISKIFVAEGAQVADKSVAIELGKEVTAGSQALVQPTNNDIDAVDNVVYTDRNNAKILYKLDGTYYTSEAGTNGTGGGDIITLNGITFTIEPSGTNYSDGFVLVDVTNNIKIYEKEGVTVCPFPASWGSAPAITQAYVAFEKVSDTKANVYHFYGGLEATKYTFEIPENYNDYVTAIETVEVDANAPVEYYNLQGVKVANPESGLFIKKQGSKTTKVVL